MAHVSMMDKLGFPACFIVNGGRNIAEAKTEVATAVHYTGGGGYELLSKRFRGNN